MKKNSYVVCFIFCLLSAAPIFAQQQDRGQGGVGGLRKVRDIVIYEDPRFHSAFPSVVQMRNGEFLLAFRRGPERRNYGEPGSNHIDPNSYLVAVRSKDGLNWTNEPELIYANPFGGSQDPCLLTLKDGTILCAGYGWAPIRDEALSHLKKPYFHADGAVFLGGFVLRSKNEGNDWEGPFYPLHIAPEINHDVFKEPVPAYNRGSLCEGKDGRIFWVVAATDSSKKTSNHLLVSNDKGLTWTYESAVAVDDEVAFNEASVY